MKINSRIIAAFFCSVCLIWIGACSSPKPQEEQGEEFEKAVDQLEDQLVGMLENIPPPSEIPYIIQSTGADFDMSLLNDINKVDQYQTDNDKAAMNLGVYATDIGYLSSYDQSQEALNYFNGSKSLGDQIGVSSAIDDERVQQFEASLGSKEELGGILDDAIDDTQGFLEESGRERTAILVASGTFSEGLHIISSLVEQFPKAGGGTEDLDASMAALAIPLVRLILEQEQPAAELNELLQSVSGDPTTDRLVSLTSELVAEYENLNIQETFEQNQAITFLQKGTMDSLVDKIKNLRAYITG
jgi:hypothetical protein